jgi:hypothetical protein
MSYLHCESLLEASMPPDEDMADLIEQAFLERQIDGETCAPSAVVGPDRLFE